MQQILDEIKQLAENELTVVVERIEALPQSGSDRRYYRVFTKDNSYIACHGNNIRENNTFINFSRHF
jgi:hypothetical protein